MVMLYGEVVEILGIEVRKYFWGDFWEKREIVYGIRYWLYLEEECFSLRYIRGNVRVFYE